VHRRRQVAAAAAADPAADLVDPDPAAPRIIANHAYDIRAVDVAAQRIALFNPWGGAHDQPRPLTSERSSGCSSTSSSAPRPPPPPAMPPPEPGATGTTTGAQAH
jgi:hypothetical protein